MTGDDAASYVGLPIYREQLARAVGFNDADVQANRSGRLGDSQRSNQYAVIGRSVALAAVFSVLTGLCLWGAFSVGITKGLGVPVLLLAVAFAAFVAIFVRFNVPLWRDVNEGVVASAEGMVRSSEKETDIKTGPFTSVPIWGHYWTVDGGDRFWVTGQAYAALTPARHRVYFLPRSRKVVAAEPIR